MSNDKSISLIEQIRNLLKKLEESLRDSDGPEEPDKPAEPEPEPEPPGDGGEDTVEPGRSNWRTNTDSPFETGISTVWGDRMEPRVVIVAGQHGIEDAGWLAAERLRDGIEVTRGHVKIIPRADPTAIDAGTYEGEKGNMNRMWTIGDDPSTKEARNLWGEIAADDPDLVLDLHSSKGIMSTDSGVGQCIFPNEGLESTADDLADHLNEAFNYEGKHRVSRGNTQTGERPLLTHKIAVDLDGRALLFESTREDTDLEHRVELTLEFLVAALRNAGIEFELAEPEPEPEALALGEDDTVQSESWIGEGNHSGVRFEARQEVDGLSAHLSEGTRPYGSDASLRAMLKDDESGDTLETVSVDRRWIHFETTLEAGTTYRLVVDADGERFDRGRAEVDYPLENDWLSVDAGIYGSGGDASETYRYAFVELAPGVDRSGDGEAVEPVEGGDRGGGDDTADRQWLALAGDDPKEQIIGEGKARTANGIRIQIHEDVEGLACRVSSECDRLHRAYLMEADSQRELYSTTVDPYESGGEVVEFPVALEAGESYRIMFDAGDDREYSRGVADDVLPIEHDLLTVTDGQYSWSLDSTTTNRYNVSEIAALEDVDELAPESTVSVPSDLEVVDIDENGRINEEKDLVPQILDYVDPDGAYRFVGDGAYRWDGEFGYSDPMPYFELCGSPKMTLEVNSDNVGQAFSFGSWGDNSPPENVVLKNVDVDISGAASRDAGLIYAMVGQIYMRNVGLVGARDRHGDHGHGGDRYTWIICTRDEDGVSVMEDCKLPDGEHLGDYNASVGYSIGFNSDPPHLGKNIWRRCYVEDQIDNGFYVAGAEGSNILESSIAVNTGNGMIRLGQNDEAYDCRSVMDRGLGRTHPGCGVWHQGGQPYTEGTVIFATAPGNDVYRVNSDADGGLARDLTIVTGPEAPSPTIRCTDTSDTNHEGMTFENFRIEDQSGVVRSSGGSLIPCARTSRPDVTFKDGEFQVSQREVFGGSNEPELINVDY